MGRSRRPNHPDAPLFHADHRRPRTRREFISQGFMAGMGTVVGSNLLNLLSPPRSVHAAIDQVLKDQCNLTINGLIQ